MDALGKFTLLVMLAFAAGNAPGQQAQPPTDTEFAEQLQHLEPKNDKETRLKALRWISRNTRQQHADLAICALEKCIRGDPETDVRQQAVDNLCQFARRFRRPCPLIVFEALHEKEDFVRYQAVVCIGLFKTFAPGSMDVLLRGAKADNAELRSSSLMLLARVAGKEPKALEAMEKATTDKVFDVRHSARMALFIARDRLEEHLPYLIRVREDPDSVLNPGPADSEDGKRDRAQRNLILLGTAMEMINWSESRADELAGVLMKLLQDKSALMRRGAARLIGAAAQKQELPRRTDADPLMAPAEKEGWWQLVLHYIEVETAPKASPEKSKVAQRLEKLGVNATLRRLRGDDSDRSVRDAAQWALERLASVPKKSP